jgi:hypothetical protein
VANKAKWDAKLSGSKKEPSAPKKESKPSGDKSPVMPHKDKKEGFSLSVMKKVAGLVNEIKSAKPEPSEGKKEGKGESKDNFETMPEGEEREISWYGTKQKVKTEPIKLNIGFDHPFEIASVSSGNKKTFLVIESQTGRTVGSNKSKKGAIEQATNIVKNTGKEKLFEQINSQLKHGFKMDYDKNSTQELKDMLDSFTDNVQNRVAKEEAIKEILEARSGPEKRTSDIMKKELSSKIYDKDAKKTKYENPKIENVKDKNEQALLKKVEIKNLKKGNVNETYNNPAFLYSQEGQEMGVWSDSRVMIFDKKIAGDIYNANKQRLFAKKKKENPGKNDEEIIRMMAEGELDTSFPDVKRVTPQDSALGKNPAKFDGKYVKSAGGRAPNKASYTDGETYTVFDTNYIAMLRSDFPDAKMYLTGSMSPAVFKNPDGEIKAVLMPLQQKNQDVPWEKIDNFDTMPESAGDKTPVMSEKEQSTLENIKRADVSYRDGRNTSFDQKKEYEKWHTPEGLKKLHKEVEKDLPALYPYIDKEHLDKTGSIKLTKEGEQKFSGDKSAVMSEDDKKPRKKGSDKQEFVDSIKNYIGINLPNDKNDRLNRRKNYLYTEIPEDRKTPVMSRLNELGITPEKHIGNKYWLPLNKEIIDRAVKINDTAAETGDKTTLMSGGGDKLPSNINSGNLTEYLTQEILKQKSPPMDKAINKVYDKINNSENKYLGEGKIQFTKEQLKNAYIDDKIKDFVKGNNDREIPYVVQRFGIPESEIKKRMESKPLQKALTLLMEDLQKAKKMPIGTVSKGYKKVAEGKWEPVGEGKGGSKKPEPNGGKDKKEPSISLNGMKDGDVVQLKDSEGNFVYHEVQGGKLGKEISEDEDIKRNNSKKDKKDKKEPQQHSEKRTAIKTALKGFADVLAEVLQGKGGVSAATSKTQQTGESLERSGNKNNKGKKEDPNDPNDPNKNPTKPEPQSKGVKK